MSQRGTVYWGGNGAGPTVERHLTEHDIQNHINGFLEEEPEHPYLCGNEPEAYLLCHDDLNNEYVFPIDADEKHCFDAEFTDDFVVDEQIFNDSIL